jgi:site-specific DNA-methyltransferase (adenine-specific)
MHIYIFFVRGIKLKYLKVKFQNTLQLKPAYMGKNNTGMGDLQGDFAPKYEMIIFCSNGTKKLNGSRDANILKAKRTKNDNHPTEKPVNLISYLIEKSSKKGDLVLDTFAGSFSTAQACKLTGRNFISFEIENEYCKTAKSLIENQMVSFF